MGRLLAISDIHLGFEANRRAIEQIRPHPEDWLLLAGDVGETPEHLELALRTLRPRFAEMVWVPGNHELWTTNGLSGLSKYLALVEQCRAHGVHTPEDPFPTWPGGAVVAPLFVLYDYSFRPDDVRAEQAVDWAAASGVLCADETRLLPDPYPTRQAWCAARADWSEQRLDELDPAIPIVLVNHFTLRYDLVTVPRIPRFSIWCGTKRTEDWHRRFNVAAVVSGHLHVRTTQWRQGVRFEEVSLGYPRQWDATAGVNHYVREILPGSPQPGRMLVHR